MVNHKHFIPMYTCGVSRGKQAFRDLDLPLPIIF